MNDIEQQIKSSLDYLQGKGYYKNVSADDINRDRIQRLLEEIPLLYKQTKTIRDIISAQEKHSVERYIRAYPVFPNADTAYCSHLDFEIAILILGYKVRFSGCKQCCFNGTRTKRLKEYEKKLYNKA